MLKLLIKGLSFVKCNLYLNPLPYFLLEMENVLKVQGLRSKVLLLTPDLILPMALSSLELDDGKKPREFFKGPTACFMMPPFRQNLGGQCLCAR